MNSNSKYQNFILKSFLIIAVTYYLPYHGKTFPEAADIPIPVSNLYSSIPRL
ncbi:hypothetical protein CDL15_Pgr007767 [Punica granatum]|uniref:Uncharacterized protein n=1 Tax=Punica granatum TaxID=22663 RepID=A0A218XAK6_PUNGR|nr:hypothetical protein CDL15_Pgr007767 [Punica granatum]